MSALLTESTPAQALRTSLQAATGPILTHEVYGLVQTPAQLQLFLERHVFAVWDFMSLLKALQQQLTSVTIPWSPTPFPLSRRLINEIVLGEESDVDPEGGFASHFELYRQAMQDAGANTGQIDRLAKLVGEGNSIEQALAQCGAPLYVQSFVQTTFSFIRKGAAHELAAAFTFGREDVIPEMFRALLNKWDGNTQSWSKFRYYLDRHIEMDGDEHGPMALRMLAEICGTDETRWDAARTAAVRALGARRALWDGIAGELAATL